MNNLSDFAVFYQKITGTTSRLEKEAILKSYKEHDGVKNVLHFLFNPFIVTGISERKLTKKVNISGCKCETLCELLDYFKIHNTGRDEDIAVLKRFTAELNETQATLVNGIIKKDLTLGASEKTLNKVFGAGFVPSFDVMLAEKYVENVTFVEGKRFIITEKLDGVRCMLIFNDAGEPTFFSRAGKSFDDMVELAQEVKQLNPQMVYDGELLLGVDESIKSADLYRMTVKVTAKDGTKTGLVYNVFDALPKTDLLKGECAIPCEQRKAQLSAELKALSLAHVKEVPILYAGDDLKKIDLLCDEYTDKGREGVMVNVADAPYECKRTKNLLKVKRFNTADVRVLNWEEGTGANKGKLGAVIVEFIAPDGKKYTCKVGSGFEKEEREYFFADPQKIVGHIIEIGYFEVSQNQKDNGYSLRFPTFKCLRDDKNEISMH
ncbi:MAG: hypothetical protein IJ295_02555 [Clostridia bacterium]|nr:hypothetical protein [Clostridia bacterium]